MPRRARVVTWNGKDGRRELTADLYLVEAVGDEVPTLSAEEGIEAALESYREGRVVDAKPVREIIESGLGSFLGLRNTRSTGRFHNENCSRPTYPTPRWRPE